MKDWSVVSLLENPTHPCHWLAIRERVQQWFSCSRMGWTEESWWADPAEGDSSQSHGSYCCLTCGMLRHANLSPGINKVQPDLKCKHWLQLLKSLGFQSSAQCYTRPCTFVLFCFLFENCFYFWFLGEKLFTPWLALLIFCGSCWFSIVYLFVCTVTE